MACLFSRSLQLVEAFRAGRQNSLVILHRSIGVALGFCKLFEGICCCGAGLLQLLFGFSRNLFVLHEVFELIAGLLDGGGQIVMDSGCGLNGLGQLVGGLLAESHHVV